MSTWLDPLRAVLDVCETRVPFFFRDDDAGWDDPALESLLDTFEPHGAPLDVAVIPTAVTERTASMLRSRTASGRNDLAMHQHGYEHLNHEPEGRKCEFGASRSSDQQRQDLMHGRAVLTALLDDLPAVFTPPWNRCAPWTPALLRELGFRVLSRDRSAGVAEVPGLREVPVTVDWFAKEQKVPVDRSGRGRLLAASAASDRPVGVMLHHAVTGAGDRADISELLALVCAHPAATTHHLHTLDPHAATVSVPIG